MKYIAKLACAATLAMLLTACDGAQSDQADKSPSQDGIEAHAQMGPEDALVAGTDYNATTILDCGFDGNPPTQSCNAGVKRNWAEEPGENLVEVTKPDGTVRAIFFKGTEPYGADSAQADGSAGWDFSSTREGDRVTVKFGPETYVIVDAMTEGG